MSNSQDESKRQRRVKTVSDLGVNEIAGIFNPSVKATHQLQKSLKKHGNIRDALRSLSGDTLAKLPWEMLEVLRRRAERQEHEKILKRVKKKGSLFEQQAKEQLRKLSENPPVTGVYEHSERLWGGTLPAGVKQKKVPIFTFGMDGVKKIGYEEANEE